MLQVRVHHRDIRRARRKNALDNSRRQPAPADPLQIANTRVGSGNIVENPERPVYGIIVDEHDFPVDPGKAPIDAPKVRCTSVLLVEGGNNDRKKGHRCAQDRGRVLRSDVGASGSEGSDLSVVQTDSESRAIDSGVLQSSSDLSGVCTTGVTTSRASVGNDSVVRLIDWGILPCHTRRRRAKYSHSGWAILTRNRGRLRCAHWSLRTKPAPTPTRRPAVLPLSCARVSAQRASGRSHRTPV
jgi:hypothetical protein